MGSDELTVQRASVERLIADLLGYVDLGGVKLAAHDSPMWVPRLGWVLDVSMWDPVTYEGPQGDLLLLPADASEADLAQVGERLARAIAALAEPGAAVRSLQRPLGRTLGLPEVTYTSEMFDPTDADIVRRAEALTTMTGRFDAVAERFRRVYGLELPRSMAVFTAFWTSLDDFERRGLSDLGLSPCGVSSYFDTDGLGCVGVDGLDERLEYRYRRDPPEFVTVMSGGTDGLHYGLWYDDPAEPPTFVASNYARDSAETGTDWSPTPLVEISRVVEEATQSEHAYRSYGRGAVDERQRWRRLAVRRALQAFTEADVDAHMRQGLSQWINVSRPAIVGPLGPALPPQAGDPRHGADQLRYEAYQARSPLVHQWIDQARRELATGRPAFALVLGQELHWLDADDYRTESLDLLVGAYRALGRDALAEIALVHHTHRDLPSVGVLAMP
jgi:hypothetical protein